MELEVVTSRIDKEFHLLLFHGAHDKAAELLLGAPVNLEALLPMGSSGRFSPLALPIVCALEPVLRRWATNTAYKCQAGQIKKLLDALAGQRYSLFKKPADFLYDAGDDCDGAAAKVAEANLRVAHAVVFLLEAKPRTTELLFQLGLTREIMRASIGAASDDGLIDVAAIEACMTARWSAAAAGMIDEGAKHHRPKLRPGQ